MYNVTTGIDMIYINIKHYTKLSIFLSSSFYAFLSVISLSAYLLVKMGDHYLTGVNQVYGPFALWF